MEAERKRSGCLTSFLIFLMFFSVLATIVNFFMLGVNTEVLNLSKGLVIVSLVLGIGQVVSIILILVWRKIGVYLYYIVGIINAVISIINKPDFTTVITISGSIIVYLIAFALIRPIWKYLK